MNREKKYEMCNLNNCQVAYIVRGLLQQLAIEKSNKFTPATLKQFNNDIELFNMVFGDIDYLIKDTIIDDEDKLDIAKTFKEFVEIRNLGYRGMEEEEE